MSAFTQVQPQKPGVSPREVDVLTLAEARARLDDLASETRPMDRSWIITGRQGESLALLTPIPDAAREREDQIARHLDVLLEMLHAWRQAVEDRTANGEFAPLFLAQLRALAEIVSDDSLAFGPLVMLLRLAVTRLLSPPPLAHLAALQAGVETLLLRPLTFDYLRAANQALLDAGLQADVDFGDELLHYYVQDS